MENKNCEQKTATIYGKLFLNYDNKLFEESVDLFFQRHKKWEIDMDWFRNKICLDAGCGGGRFLVALARLGGKEVVGIDISREAVGAANKRARERRLNQVTAIEASVLKIPYPDGYFDYVVSSGVIHHTPDPFGAFLELDRVLKPGGKLFLSVYGKGGIRWLINDLFRYTICKFIPFEVTEKIFQFFGIPANKRYNIIDNLYVPYCYRFTEKEIYRWLDEKNYINLKRMKFERYDYETLWSRIIYGEGWIQIYADKKQ